MKKTIDVKVKFVLSYEYKQTGSAIGGFHKGTFIEEYDDLKLFKAASLITAKNPVYENIKGYRVSDTWEISKKDTLVMK